MNFYTKVALLVALPLSYGCSPGVVPVPPNPDPDVRADCEIACNNIGPEPEGLGCEEGKPTADGQTCQQVCEGIPNTTQNYLDCVATVSECDQISRCPR